MRRLARPPAIPSAPAPTGAAEPAVKSALRVFAILEAFHALQRPLRLHELAGHLGYPASSTAGLLKTMATAGYLRFDPAARSYQPTPLLARLVAWVPGVSFETECVGAAMRRLHQETGELVVLGAAEDLRVTYVEALRSTHGFQLWTPPGTSLPIINLGLGWMFLGRMVPPGMRAVDSPELGEILARSVAQDLPHAARIPLAALAERVESARRQDVLFTDERAYLPGTHPGHPGGGMVWVLLPTPPGHRPLGIGIGGPAQRLAANLDRYGAALRREAGRIGAELAG